MAIVFLSEAVSPTGAGGKFSRVAHAHCLYGNLNRRKSRILVSLMRRVAFSWPRRDVNVETDDM